MPEQASSGGPSVATRAARVIAISVVVMAAILAAYSLSRVARDLPDAYPGQVRGGLFVSLAMLAGSGGQLIETSRARTALAIISLLLTVTAMYFFFARRASTMPQWRSASNS